MLDEPQIVESDHREGFRYPDTNGGKIRHQHERHMIVACQAGSRGIFPLQKSSQLSLNFVIVFSDKVQKMVSAH